MPVAFSSDTGRATHVNFPYFNLEYGTVGAMLAIGWAGTWAASFDFDGEKTHCTLQSANGINTKLHAGERICTALFVTAPYTVRDEYFATNYCRRWVRLPFADDGKVYKFTDEDTKAVITADGKTARTRGITLDFDKPRTAKLLRFEVQK